MDIEGVRIEFLGHSGFLIECLNKKIIVIDPYNVSDKVGKADYILITHSHYDHCSIKDIEKISKDGTVVVVPAGVRHNIINTGAGAMKLYTLYAPPNHKSGVVHKTKAEARADEGEHFDGATSE